MARLVEEVVTVKFSKLVKDNDTDVPEILNVDMLESIEDSLQSMVSNVVLIEVTRTGGR